MEKFADKKLDNGMYVKRYYVNTTASIEKLMDTGINFASVRLIDDADVGLKIFDGTLSYSDFLTIYPKLSLSISGIVFTMYDGKGSISFNMDDETATLRTYDSKLELDDILGKNKMSL